MFDTHRGRICVYISICPKMYIYSNRVFNIGTGCLEGGRWARAQALGKLSQ